MAEQNLMTIELASSIALGIRVIGPLALATIGFALIYRVSGHLHFAYGGLWVLASYVVGSQLERGAGPFTGFLLATAVTIPLALICYLTYRRLVGQFTIALTSFGIFTAVLAVVQLYWGPQRIGFSSEHPLSSVWRTSISGVGMAIPQAALAGLASASLLALVGAMLLGSTSVGLRLQALAQNPELAKILGVRSGRINGLCYVVGTVIANLSATFHVLGYGASLDAGTGMVLGALTVAILSGFVIIATVVGSVVFGLLQVLANIFAGSDMINLIGYSILLLILRIRPNGLFHKDWTLDFRRSRQRDVEAIGAADE